jgi:uroporphyrinogen decarboxylase
MQKSERVLAALRGAPVDRPPISFWFHLGLEQESPEVVARAELELFRLFDLDWLKVMHDSPFDGPELVGSMRSPNDLRRLRAVAPDCGGFARQAEVLRRIADGLGGDALFVETVFSPWSIARMLAGNRLAGMLRADPAAVRAGLRIIADSVAGYVLTAIATGAAGIFYVVDGAALYEEEELLGALDREILQCAAGAPFNILHVHGKGVRLAPFRHHAVAALSFSPGSGQPTLAEARRAHSAALMTGLDEATTMAFGSPEDVRDELHRSLREAGPAGLLVAPGCALTTDVTEARLWAARDAVSELAAMI